MKFFKRFNVLKFMYIGVAWTAAMCDKKYSCSLIEANSFMGTYTMAHELGHSLGELSAIMY